MICRLLDCCVLYGVGIICNLGGFVLGCCGCLCDFAVGVCWCFLVVWVLARWVLGVCAVYDLVGGWFVGAGLGV